MNTEQIFKNLLDAYFFPRIRIIIRQEIKQCISPSEAENEFLNAQESATFIGDALQTFYGRTSRGEIATYGSGKRIFCKRSELQAWKEKNRTQSKEDLNEEIRTRVKNRVKN